MVSFAVGRFFEFGSKDVLCRFVVGSVVLRYVDKLDIYDAHLHTRACFHIEFDCQNVVDVLESDETFFVGRFDVASARVVECELSLRGNVESEFEYADNTVLQGVCNACKRAEFFKRRIRRVV